MTARNKCRVLLRDFRPTEPLAGLSMPDPDAGPGDAVTVRGPDQHLTCDQGSVGSQKSHKF